MGGGWSPGGHAASSSILTKWFSIAMPVQGVSFKRYVEVGRVALVTKGEYKNKLVTIVEIVDQNRVCIANGACATMGFSAPGDTRASRNRSLTLQAVVDGPSTGVPRQVMSYRDMTLTRFVIKVPRAAGTPTVKKAFDASGVAEKWAESKWAKTLAAREARKNTTDCTYQADGLLTLQSSAPPSRCSRSSAVPSLVPLPRRCRPNLDTI